MIEQSTLSRILKRMEAEGLLAKRQSAQDKRVRAIELTAAGRARYDTVRTVAMTHVGHIVSDLSQDERAQLSNFVARMQKKAQIGKNRKARRSLNAPGFANLKPSYFSKPGSHNAMIGKAISNPITNSSKRMNGTAAR